jgi:hypothetical protein
MSWIKGQLGTLITAVALLVTVGISFGRLDTRQEEMCVQLQGKADNPAVTREMDQIQARLAEINQKLDALLLHRANNPNNP